MKRVTITTDGACIGNPGPGGWACVLRFNTFMRESFGSESRTTNNRMELRAVIEALRTLKEPCEVEVYTDSEYVKRGVSEWLSQWKARGWRTISKRGGKAVANQDLWMDLDEAAQRHKISWKWVKGHASHMDNVRCDELAQQAARLQTSSPGIAQRAWQS